MYRVQEKGQRKRISTHHMLLMKPTTGRTFQMSVQHTATHCNTLQHAATNCHKLQYTARLEMPNPCVIHIGMIHIISIKLSREGIFKSF